MQYNQALAATQAAALQTNKHGQRQSAAAAEGQQGREPTQQAKIYVKSETKTHN